MKSARLLLHASAAIALLMIVAGCQTPPNVPGVPTGFSQVKKNVPVPFATKTTDPAGLTVSYQFDWGDQVQSQWTAYGSGDSTVTDTHSFTKGSTASVRARARNNKGGTSAWSEPLVVSLDAGESSLRMMFGYEYDPESPGDSAEFEGSVALSPDASTIYAVSDNDLLHFIDQYGARKYGPYVDPDYDVTNSPSVASDGRCYVGYSEPQVDAINPGGQPAPSWPKSLSGDIKGLVAIDKSGNIYFNCDDGKVHSYSSAGEERWASTSTTGGGPSSPAISSDDALLFVGGDDSMIHAFRTSDGGQAWPPIKTRRGIGSSPAIGSDGKFYIGSDDSMLRQVVGATGGTPVGYDAHSSISASPVIGPDGTVYVTSDNGVLHAIDPTSMAAKWTLALNGTSPSSAAISSGNVLYVFESYADVGGLDTLLAIDLTTHARRWSAPVETPANTEIDNAPVIDPSGTVYLTASYKVLGFWGTGGPASSSWPMLGHDARHTGQAQ